MSLLASATDLTSTVSSLLVDTHNSPAIELNKSIRSLDAFLSNAGQINKSLAELISYARSIRAPYLSTAPPPTRKKQIEIIPSYLTDAQREDIVAETTSLLTGVRANIQSLEAAENARHQVVTTRLEKKYGKAPTSFLFKWAAGNENPDITKPPEQIAEEGAERTLHEFRASIVLYLGEWYDKATLTFQEIVDKRRAREAEKKASALYDARNKHIQLQDDTNVDMRASDTYNPALDTYDGVEELSAEQLQMFEAENNSLMQHYNDQLSQVSQVEKSLFEISSLQQTLIGHLETQSEIIGGLVEDAMKTDENVSRGNKELKRATERTSTAKVMYHSTLWICAGLIVWDLIF